MGEGGEGEWDGKEEDVRQRGRREGGAGCGGRRKGGGEKRRCGEGEKEGAKSGCQDSWLG